MKVRLILVGRTERGFVADGTQHYLTRLDRSMPVEVTILPDEGRGGSAFQQRTESERILAAIRPGEKVVVLDERGAALTSRAFASKLGAWRDQGVKQLVFIIGGAYGMTDEVRERADLLLAISAMTFPHQLIRVLFAEQLYRAVSILNDGPYHH